MCNVIFDIWTIRPQKMFYLKIFKYVKVSDNALNNAFRQTFQSFSERCDGSVCDTPAMDSESCRQPLTVPLLGWHAGRPAGPSDAKRRASRRMGRVASHRPEEAATAKSAAAAGADAERLTLMHDVQIKRRRRERQCAK